MQDAARVAARASSQSALVQAGAVEALLGLALERGGVSPPTVRIQVQTRLFHTHPHVCMCNDDYFERQQVITLAGNLDRPKCSQDGPLLQWSKEIHRGLSFNNGHAGMLLCHLSLIR